MWHGFKGNKQEKTIERRSTWESPKANAHSPIFNILKLIKRTRTRVYTLCFLIVFSRVFFSISLKEDYSSFNCFVILVHSFFWLGEGVVESIGDEERAVLDIHFFFWREGHEGGTGWCAWILEGRYEVV